LGILEFLIQNKIYIIKAPQIGAFFMFVHIYNKGYKEHMSTHTNKIDSNIIEIAKQRYESKQRSKLPSIIVSLASAGKIYPESSPLRAGQIEMRYMTAYDEDILTNTSYIKNGVVFDKLLESIIVTEGVLMFKKFQHLIKMD
jgi:hypothetical protein